MISKLTNIFINNHIIDKEDAEIYEYGIFVVLFNLLSIGAIIVLGILFNRLSFTLEFLLFYIPNRMIIGGYHCKTPQRCFITFTSSYIIILISTYIIPYSNILYLISILLYIFLLIMHFKTQKSFKIFFTLCFIIFIILTMNIMTLRQAFIYAIVLNTILYEVNAINR